ncbi:MAG: carbohydrate ABC transporter permease [Ruminiclostridium sp.]|nr:carbohydrate ABC transporter permease [Ruminiclostridium sp.]
MKSSKLTTKLTSISDISNTILNIIFILFSIMCLLPLLIVLSASFSNETAIVRNGYSIIPQGFTFLAYRFMFTDGGQILRSYGISVFVTITGTVISCILISLYAYPLSRKDLPFRNFFSFYVFSTMLFNGGLVPFYLIYTRFLHLQDKIAALIIPMLVNPFFVILMRTFFSNTIPDSVLESAKIDGASELKILLRIVYPLSLPVIATIALFNTLAYWNDWFLSLILITSDNKISLQYYMYKVILNLQFLLNSLQGTGISASGSEQLKIPSETIRMAMAVLGMGPVIIAYPFFQRYFIKGLTIGSVKG